ncbi:bicaudal-D-related protein 2-like [Oncorhynchus nerka]|uniref:bicaudal-D-related protein 2-like n=1 Tax=Oncorhynchus nerka TaxID=8023 RepID=UPI00113101A8|nr:BICD family-like cargo adapter 2 [Oncorhynchus nerka]
MGDPVPFSILNERLRPQFTAMEQLCYSLHTLEDGHQLPGIVSGSSTTRSTILRDEIQKQDDSSSTTTEPEDDPEKEDVVTERLTSLTEEGDNCHDLLTMTSTCLMQSLTAEDAGPDGSGELTVVKESLAIENGDPGVLTMVSEGDGSDEVSEDKSPFRRSYVDRILPDLIRSGQQLSRRRTLGPVSDTLKEVRREVALSVRRSLRLKAQVDKLQENRDEPGWIQHREKVTEEVQSVLRLLLPLTEAESSTVEPSVQENSLDTALVLLQNVARKLALSHTAQDSQFWVKKGNGMDDSAVLQQALRDRDDAMDKKKAMEAELLRSKTEMMLLNNQLLEAVQKRLELSLELEAWKDDIQRILQQQLQSQQEAEQAQRKPSRLGLLRRTKEPPHQRPASTPAPSPALQRTPVTWRDRLKRGKTGRHGDQDAAQASPVSRSSSSSSRLEGFHTIDL